MPRRLYSATIPILGLIGLLEISRHATRAVPTNRSSDSLRIAPVLHLARAAQTLMSLPSGDLLVVGGFTTGLGWSFLASAEVCDPRTQRFTTTGAMQEARENHAAIRLRDGRVLVVGGHRGRGSAIVISRTAEVYDATTGRFSPTK